jgi:hypothetical protein
MKAEHLVEDEVEWELQFRRVGFNATDKLADKQRILRTILRAEVKGAPELEGRLWDDINLVEEQEDIGAKLQSISQDLVTKGQKSSNFLAYESRLIHLKRRLEAVLKQVRNPTQREEGSKLQTFIHDLLNKFFSNCDSAIKVSGASSLVRIAQEIGPSLPVTPVGSLVDLSVEQDPVLKEISKGAIRKTLQVSTAEKTDDFSSNTGTGFNLRLTHDRLEKRLDALKLGFENSEIGQKEIKLKAMQENIEKRLKSLENGNENSEDELEALIEIQKAMQTKIELLQLRKRDTVLYSKNEMSRSVSPELDRNSHRSRARSRRSSDSSTESDSSSEARFSQRQRHRHRRNDSPGLPVARWGVKFSGDDDVTVMDFLRQIEIWKKSEKISGSKLLSKAHQLLKGSAWVWFTSSSERFSRWKDFVKGLKEAFTPEDFDFILLQECQKRQQLRTETFEIYLARMNQLFDSISYTLSEKTKLSILKQNLKSSHKVGIAMLDIKTIEGLRKYCRRLDSLDSSLYVKQSPQISTKNILSKAQIFEIEETAETPRNKDTKRERIKSKKKSSGSNKDSKRERDQEICGVEQPCNYRPRNTTNSSKQNQNQKGFFKQRNSFGNKQAVNNTVYVPVPTNNQKFLESWAAAVTGQQPQQSNAETGSGFPNVTAQAFTPQPWVTRVNPTNQQEQSICWNCDGLNHHQRFCTAPRRKFCFGCGYKDVYRNDCPNCSGNGTQRLSSGAQQSQ